MKIHRLLVIAAVPILISACSLAGAGSSTANNSDRIAQDSSQPGEQRGWRGRRRLNFAEAAQKLGVTEAKLKEALGVPSTDTETNENGRPRRPRLDIRGAAAKLGVTEEQLVNALGLPPRPNFAAAAKKLGVTEEKLKEAVGVPTNATDSSNQDRPRRPRVDIKGVLQSWA